MANITYLTPWENFILTSIFKAYVTIPLHYKCGLTETNFINWDMYYFSSGAELGGCQGGHCPPKILSGPPSGPPKIFQVSFWKSYTDHWQLPLLQNWPLQWPPQMKKSGSTPAFRAVKAYILFSFDQADTILSMLKNHLLCPMPQF